MSAPLFLNAYFPSCNGSTYTVHFQNFVEPRAPTAPCYWVHCTVVPLHLIGELTMAWGGLMKIRSRPIVLNFLLLFPSPPYLSLAFLPFSSLLLLTSLLAISHPSSLPFPIPPLSSPPYLSHSPPLTPLPSLTIPPLPSSSLPLPLSSLTLLPFPLSSPPPPSYLSHSPPPSPPFPSLLLLCTIHVSLSGRVNI